MEPNHCEKVGVSYHKTKWAKEMRGERGRRRKRKKRKSLERRCGEGGH